MRPVRAHLGARRTLGLCGLAARALPVTAERGTMPCRPPSASSARRRRRRPLRVYDSVAARWPAQPDGRHGPGQCACTPAGDTAGAAAAFEAVAHAPRQRGGVEQPGAARGSAGPARGGGRRGTRGRARDADRRGARPRALLASGRSCSRGGRAAASVRRRTRRCAGSATARAAGRRARRCRCARASGPVTFSPTASHMRRIWRFLPSRSTKRSWSSLTHSTCAGFKASPSSSRPWFEAARGRRPTAARRLDAAARAPGTPSRRRESSPISCLGDAPVLRQHQQADRVDVEPARRAPGGAGAGAGSGCRGLRAQRLSGLTSTTAGS